MLRIYFVVLVGLLNTACSVGESVQISPSTLTFGNQLIGSAAPPQAVSITNTGKKALKIREIEIEGADAADFPITSNVTLPLTLKPGEFTSITVGFTPGAPWKPGTRHVHLEVESNDGNERARVTGIGISCAGPVFAAESNGLCADTDGDGFNDAWEDNGYVDMNNNGIFDPGIDFAFPRRTPYVFSDVVQTGNGIGQVFPTVTDPSIPIADSVVAVSIVTSGAIGASTFTYSINSRAPVGPLEIRPVVDLQDNLRLMFYLGSFTAGDNYTFSAGMGADSAVANKNLPNIYVQYDYMDWDAAGNACSIDSDCDAGGTQLNSVCHAGACTHNHYPGDPLFRKVVDQFAKHGIALYVFPEPKAVPHAQVVTWSQPGDGTNGAKAECAGADVVAGNIGPGQFAVNFHDIKNRPGSDFALDPFRKRIYHYAVLGHDNTCQGSSCRTCPPDRSTPAGFPFSTATGLAELPGNDFIVSLASVLTYGSAPTNPFIEEGVFMHELGHNIGLHHDGDVPAPQKAPNYLSVMNYRYSLSGIQHAATPGSTAAVESLRELNYSEHELNTLDESHLDETAGASPLSSGYTGIVRFWNSLGVSTSGPESGPVDWSGNGFIDSSPVTADLNQLSGPTELMKGYRDWDHPALDGGSCKVSTDCRVNAVRLNIHDNLDPTVDIYEPCIRSRCQSLWFAFQNTPWGKAD